jgi:hypothetical protein
MSENSTTQQLHVRLLHYILSCQDQSEIVVEFHGVVQNHPSTCDGWTNTVRATHSHQWTTVVSADLGSVDLTGTCLIISVVIDREEFFSRELIEPEDSNAISPHLIAIEEQLSEMEHRRFS